MRLVERWASDKDKQPHQMRLQPDAPLLTLEECAEALGMTYEQVKYLHASALQKIGAALSVYGYHKEIAR